MVRNSDPRQVAPQTTALMLRTTLGTVFPDVAHTCSDRAHCAPELVSLSALGSAAEQIGLPALAQIRENPTIDKSSTDNSLLIIFKPIQKGSFSARDDLLLYSTALAK